MRGEEAKGGFQVTHSTSFYVILLLICNIYVSPSRGIRFVLHGVSDRSLSLAADLNKMACAIFFKMP